MRGAKKILRHSTGVRSRSRPPSTAPPMEVLFLTTLFSVLFAILFLALFLRSRQDGRSCSDQDALLPFRDEPVDPTLPHKKTQRLSTDHDQ
jgi:hypothetical protein